MRYYINFHFSVQSGSYTKRDVYRITLMATLRQIKRILGK